MTWDLTTGLFLQLHVALSLAGLGTGILVILSMLRGRLPWRLTNTALAALILTDITGFPLAPFGIDPARIIGIVSLVLLGVALLALHGGRLAGASRWLFPLAAIPAVYLDALVTIVQAFQKLPPLAQLAPTQTELPFIVVQGLTLAFFAAALATSLRVVRPQAAI